MLFGKDKSNIAVLESKFQIYEDLSKEMLDKLERAVATIGDNSNRISLILERHEMRLEQSDKADEAILKLIEKVEQQIKDVELKVSNLSRFRWIAVGISLALITVIESNAIFANFLTPNPSPAKVDQYKN
jgi:hypothetical protein